MTSEPQLRDDPAPEISAPEDPAQEAGVPLDRNGPPLWVQLRDSLLARSMELIGEAGSGVVVLLSPSGGGGFTQALERKAGGPAGDEILTWLSDNRAYARLFFESRQTPAEPSATAASAGAQIKF